MVVGRFFLDGREYTTFANGLLEVLRLHVQLAAYDRVKRLFRVWLALHIVVSLFMVALIVVLSALPMLRLAWEIIAPGGRFSTAAVEAGLLPLQLHAEV